VRDVRELAQGAVLRRAVAGMILPGTTDVNPAVNAVQTLGGVHRADGWRVALFQSTPAAFHGRPEDVEKLTAELRAALPTWERDLLADVRRG
jgi:hypothetical protein